MARKPDRPATVPEPTLTPTAYGFLATWEPSDVAIEVHQPRRDAQGRLRADVVARLGDSIVNQADIALLNQRDRVDFHSLALQRDGRVDWGSHLLALISPLQAALEQQPRPEAEGTETAANPWAQARPAPVFLAGADEQADWLVPNLAAPGSVAGLMAPRGLGKTHIAHALMVGVATGGLWCGAPIRPGRVLLIDRDNSPREIRRRLRAWGGVQAGDRLRILTRDEAPDLQDAQAWAAFPFGEYDLVVLDSIGAATERITETDTGATGKALAHLLDLARRGPAVLLLGNTVKSAAHYRGSGTWADRLDILYEVRDATDFMPSGKGAWWLELPEAGEAAWGARAARRKRRTDYRLALVPSKFRIGEEPEPWCLEIHLADPWSLRDVTAELVATGDQAREQDARAAAEARHEAITALARRVAEQAAAGSPLLTEAAETLLRAGGMTRKAARAIIRAGTAREWTLHPGEGPGHPVELRPLSHTIGGGNTRPLEPLGDAACETPNSAAGSGSGRRNSAPVTPLTEQATADGISAADQIDIPTRDKEEGIV